MNKIKISKLYKNHKVNLLFIIFISIIGTYLLLTSKAAIFSSFIEPENGNISGNAIKVDDSQSQTSGRKYIKFRKATLHRFPGDPNPKVSKKAYWGANVNALLADGTKTSDVYTRHEKGGKSLSLYHRYYQWSSLDGTSIITNAKNDQVANRLPYITFKTDDDWSAVGSGVFDAKLDKFIKALDAIGRPVWITAWHEPENDTNGTTRTSATWLSMQRRIKQRMNAANNGTGTKNIAFMPHLMDWTYNSKSNRNPEDWWADGIWDVAMFSNYCSRDCVDSGGNTYDSMGRIYAINFFEKKGIPWGLGEWSFSERRTGPLMFTQYFKPYWEWGFNNNKDAVAYSYFDADESRPDPTSPYYASLRDANLDEFHNILWNDQRVQRINDL